MKTTETKSFLNWIYRGTLVCLAIVCCLCFVGCDDNTDEQVNTPADEQPAFSLSLDQQINNAFSNSDRDATYDSVTATVTLSDAGHTVDGTGAAVEGNVVRIQNAGNYVISGTCTNGQIIVTAAKEDKVRLVLNGMSLQSATDAPLIVESADKVTLTLAAGTENAFSDANQTASAPERSEGANACVYSREDLVINGEGALTIHGNFNNGIASKDDLRIVSGTVTVASARNNGLKGKDAVSILDGTILVKSDDDGIKSDNETDAGRGVINMFGGNVTIECGDDGFQATTSIQIAAGTATVRAGGQQLNSPNSYAAPGCLQR